MALLEISTFATLTKLLLAARKLAEGDTLLDRAKSLADLAENGRKLNAALRDRGLSALAAALDKTAKDADRAFARTGQQATDARALFWQVMPVALADPTTLTGANLRHGPAVNGMVTAIQGSKFARDFRAEPLAETYFRAIADPVLKQMLDDTGYVNDLTPALWREALSRQGFQIALLCDIKDDTGVIRHDVAELKALMLEALEQTGEAAAARDSGITDKQIVALAQEVAEDVTDPQAAFAELEAAVADARAFRARAQAGSNTGSFVSDLLARLDALAAEGKLTEAQAEASDAFDRWQADEADRQARAVAEGAEILDAALQQDLALRDIDAAANRLIRKADLEAGGSAGFEGLFDMHLEWKERGRDKGILRDQEISIELARQMSDRAATPTERGRALGQLAFSLQERGERDSNPARLIESVETYSDVLRLFTRESDPENWVRTQVNFGNALVTLGRREAGTGRLVEAVAAYRAALEEWTRDRVPLQWATTQMNLGNALRTLGEREAGTDRLIEAVAAYRAALEEFTRDRVPLEWALTQMNLGNALVTLGQREEDSDRLIEAVAAYRAALEEFTRDRVPLDWALTQMNLGSALLTLGQREEDSDRLIEAVAAYRAALEEFTRDRVPLQWAMVQGNLCNVELAIFEKSGDPARLDAAELYLAAERAVFTEAGASHYLAIADRQAGEIATRRASLD